MPALFAKPIISVRIDPLTVRATSVDCDANSWPLARCWFKRARALSPLSRSLLRQEGLRVPTGGSITFHKPVRALGLDALLTQAIEPLLQTHEQLCEQIKRLDAEIAVVVQNDARAARLLSVPSIGPVTALTFIAVLDDVGRFSSGAQLTSYIGLTPREYSSGERQQRGHITRAGNTRLRSLLVECAWGILRRQHPSTEPLRLWALGIAARRGSASQQSPWPVGSAYCYSR